jgi:hypothetical protein
MSKSTSIIRLRRLLLVGAIVAGIAVPAAAAVGRPPDVQDAANAALAGQISPPDVRDAALETTVVVPDAFERYAAAHPYGVDLADDSSTLVSRPPDITDAVLAAQYGSASQPSTGFDWGDWAIGIGSGTGLMLLLGAGLVAGRQFRHDVRTA